MTSVSTIPINQAGGYGQGPRLLGCRNSGHPHIRDLIRRENYEENNTNDSHFVILHYIASRSDIR